MEKKWSLRQRMIWLTVRIILPPIIKTLYSFRVIGGSNIPPEGEGIIIAANHRSHFDSIAIGVALVPRLSLFMASKKAMESNRFFNMLRLIGAFPVDQRPGKGETALEYARRAVARGLAVIIYPEGKRIRKPSELGKAKTGVARVAIPTGKPIIPTYVSGTTDILPPGKIIPKIRKEVIVAFGKPLDPNMYVKQYPDDRYRAIKTLTNDIMVAIYNLYQDIETKKLSEIQEKRFGKDIFQSVIQWLETT